MISFRSKLPHIVMLALLPLSSLQAVEQDLWWRAVSFADHNTRVVVLGCLCLGAAAGMVGTFLVLRRRALMGDTLGHSTLPGVTIAFLVLMALGQEPRSLPVLLMGGALSALLGALLVDLIRRLPKLSDDSALAIVLGVLFGAGLVILGVINQLGSGKSSGLNAFIDGQVSSMLTADSWQMAGIALTVILTILLLFKELTLSTFDRGHARVHGLSLAWMDLIFLLLVVMVTVAGLKAVGLILIIALLVIPAGTAINCCRRLPWVVALAACTGALSGALGAWLSAVFPRLPTGALIVLIAALFFVVSCIFGPVGGWWWRRAARKRHLQSPGEGRIDVV